MYDGSKIANCKAKHGGGIEVNSTAAYNTAVLGMAGGSIESCEADDGGGVYMNIGMFQMQGGTITDNHATKEDTGSVRTGGGGIYVAGESKVAAVLIGGGKVADNTAVSSGGGVLIQGSNALLQLQGGSLEGNRAKTGGGISAIKGNVKLYGGTVTGNIADLYGGGLLGSPYSLIELQGNPKVFGNNAGDTSDQFHNLYLDGAEDDSPAWATSPIRLTGPLTEGVQLGLSRWVRPDEGEHSYREMIVPYKGYTIQQEDLDKLNIDGQLYADNMEKYAFIPYEERVVMVLAVNVVLDKNKLSFDGAGETDSLIATVLPVNALIKDVFWLSSDPDVATVDTNGIVTAVAEGEAVITVTTVSPYNATASCKVTVGKGTGPEEGEAGPGDPIPDKDPDEPKDTESASDTDKNARENEKEVGEIIREVVREPAKTYEGEKEKPTAEWMDGIQIDFERLMELNDDTAGWIIFHNQRVNYPLVQTDNNSYYLNHSFRGEENKAGSIFMDYRNNSLEDRHVVIYGHNMLDRTMFGSLKDVFHKKFWEEDNNLIYLFDKDHYLRKYKIFSYYTVEKEDYYITTLFRNDTEYAEFLEVLQARSFGETDVSVTTDDHILTLSTCAGASGTKRRVIHAKLLQEKMD